MHLSDVLTKLPSNFRTSLAVRKQLIEICAQNSDIAAHYYLGDSEEGRPVDAFVIGRGGKTVSLIAGAHSDEPVGPETLRIFILESLQLRQELTDLFDVYRFIVIPNINPDGEMKNQPWITKWPDVSEYIRHAFRERPGRDIEFGYPEMRAENQLVSAFLKEYAPLSLHMSLHGMGFSEGVMLLIERHWIDQTAELRSRFAEYAKNLQLRLHDHDRKGEKGFLYIGPGFTTTPEGQAMQAYFRSLNDETTAQKFHLSSMEYARELGGNPLSLVTELPLFVIDRMSPHKPPGIPSDYLDFKEEIPRLQLQLAEGKSIAETLDRYKVRSFDLAAAVKFQLFVIQLGLETIG